MNTNSSEGGGELSELRNRVSRAIEWRLAPVQYWKEFEDSRMLQYAADRLNRNRPKM